MMPKMTSMIPEYSIKVDLSYEDNDGFTGEGGVNNENNCSYKEMENYIDTGKIYEK